MKELNNCLPKVRKVVSLYIVMVTGLFFIASGFERGKASHMAQPGYLNVYTTLNCH